MGLPRCDGPTAVRQLRRDPSYAALKILARLCTSEFLADNILKYSPPLNEVRLVARF